MQAWANQRDQYEARIAEMNTEICDFEIRALKAENANLQDPDMTGRTSVPRATQGDISLFNGDKSKYKSWKTDLAMKLIVNV